LSSSSSRDRVLKTRQVPNPPRRALFTAMAAKTYGYRRAPSMNEVCGISSQAFNAGRLIIRIVRNTRRDGAPSRARM
jgi:hypothetical protein